MKGWFADAVACKPVEYEADVFGFPNRTKDGEKQYENTHFRTEKEAWDRLMSETESGVMVFGRNVADHEEALRRAKDSAAHAARKFSAVRDGFEKWKAEA